MSDAEVPVILSPATTEPDEPSIPEFRRPATSELIGSIGDLWRARELLYELTLRDIRVRYKQAAFGVAWALLTPIFVVLGGVVARAALAGGHHGIDRTALASIAVKAVPWSFFVGAIGFSTPSLSSNSTLLTKVFFPREVLPISTVAAHLVDLSAGSLAVTVLLLVIQTPISLTVLWVPLMLVLLVLFTMGSSLVLSCANLFFRDVKYAVQILLTFGIFFTPIFFEPAMFGPVGARIAMMNPMAPLLEGVRVAVVEQHNLLVPLVTPTGVVAWDPIYLVYGLATSILGLFVALILFARFERSFADYV